MPSLLELIQVVVAILLGASIGFTLMHALSSDE
jgi:predicted permease